jgi:hypothetical protein
MTATTTVATIIPIVDPGSPQNQFGGASGIAAQINAAVASRTAVADAAYAVLASDREVSFATLTASTVVTLCAASAFPVGTDLLVADDSGNCSATITIAVAAAGSDHISGATSLTITTAYGSMRLRSNGSNMWKVV